MIWKWLKSYQTVFDVKPTPFLIGGLVHGNKGTGVQLHVRCMQEQAILKDVNDASSVECNIT